MRILLHFFSHLPSRVRVLHGQETLSTSALQVTTQSEIQPNNFTKVQPIIVHFLSSEQHLVDCSQSYHNGGCDGGWMFWSWDYLKNNGFMKSPDYPYTSGANGKVSKIVASPRKKYTLITCTTCCSVTQSPAQSLCKSNE